MTVAGDVSRAIDAPNRDAICVALTTTIEKAAGAHGRSAVFVYTSYMDALERAGLTPVLLTPAHSRAAIAALLASCSGLVLTGGEDVEPWRYDERPRPALGDTFAARDDMEFRALDMALSRDMPIFGICRGCQVLNVHFGGSLYQDIDTERPGSLLHEQNAAWSERTHGATVQADSLLARVIGVTELRTNSFHHQAVREPGGGLRVVAHAEDGLVEAIEHGTRPWVLGVQWHPERQESDAPDTDPDRRLFTGFHDAVQQYAVSSTTGFQGGI